MIRWGGKLVPRRIRKPRASGDDPTVDKFIKDVAAVNPARAGMIHRGIEVGLVRPRKPRASGDDPRIALVVARNNM